MTTIHIKPSKSMHFPAAHQSLYEQNGGWIIKPSETIPFLQISEDKSQTEIDIHIPGVPSEQIEVMDARNYTRRVTKLGPNDEIVHVVIPKTNKAQKTVQSRNSPRVYTHMVYN